MRRRIERSMALLALATAALAGGASAQGAVATTDTVTLSLEQAEERALEESEEIRLARSSVDLARSQVTEVRAQALPQLNANVGYTRTLASVFQQAAAPEVPDSLRFSPDPTRPLAERVAYLEDKAPAAALGALGGLFSNLPFGRENAYTASLSGSQLLYSGGQVGAAMSIARSYRSAAESTLTQQSAQIQLEVRRAYYQALLAGEMTRIAEAALAQAESFLAQEQLRLRAGQASDLEVMRAEVSRDNLRPQLVAAKNAADLALLNLKRLVNLPLTQALRLTTPLTPPAVDSAAARPSRELVRAQEAQLSAVEQQVDIAADQVRIARGSFLPSVSLATAYARQLYPSEMFRVTEPWQQDWTVSLQISLPLLNGGARNAQLQQARLNRSRAQLQLAQLREGLQLQYEQARAEKERALASIQARQRTVDVAQRVYDLTVLRYDRGLATQLEVSDARLSLLQARSNLAQAIADYHIADTGQATAVSPAGQASAAG
jgi:outer membrane protein TolC